MKGSAEIRRTLTRKCAALGPDRELRLHRNDRQGAGGTERRIA